MAITQLNPRRSCRSPAKLIYDEFACASILKLQAGMAVFVYASDQRIPPTCSPRQTRGADLTLLPRARRSSDETARMVNPVGIDGRCECMGRRGAGGKAG